MACPKLATILCATSRPPGVRVDPGVACKYAVLGVPRARRRVPAGRQGRAHRPVDGPRTASPTCSDTMPDTEDIMTMDGPASCSGGTNAFVADAT